MAQDALLAFAHTQYSPADAPAPVLSAKGVRDCNENFVELLEKQHLI